MKIIPPVEVWKNVMTMQDNGIQIYVVFDDTIGMDRFIEKLWKWATEDWVYDNVVWVPEGDDFGQEYLLVKDKDADGKDVYYKMHYLMGEDYDGLFNGAWDDSPEPLNENQYARAAVYFTISEEEFTDLMKKYREN